MQHITPSHLAEKNYPPPRGGFRGISCNISHPVVFFFARGVQVRGERREEAIVYRERGGPPAVVVVVVVGVGGGRGSSKSCGICMQCSQHVPCDVYRAKLFPRRLRSSQIR